MLVTSAINEGRTADFLRQVAPDIVLVNGTQLLRAPVLELIPAIRHGIINLHTGLSPYSRGANCNLYMLMEGHPELVGVTVHHIDPGIDSGDIILSAHVPMQPDDNVETIEVRSFQVGIELLIEAARRLEAGTAPRVPQWEKGKLFLRRTGYVYEPWQRLMANRRIARGLVRDYLADQARRDGAVRVVRGSSHEPAGAGRQPGGGPAVPAAVGSPLAAAPAGKVLCLLYHRVDEPGREPFLDRFGVPPIPPEELAAELGVLQRRGARFLTYADLRAGRFPTGSEFGVIVSFDDGLRCNYEEGMDVLQGLGIPAVFFQSTAMDAGGELVWEHALYWYGAHPTLAPRLEQLARQRLDLPADLEGAALIARLRDGTPVVRVRELLAELAEHWGTAGELAAAAERLYPSGEHLRRAREAGHELGSHGHHHVPRCNISPEAFEEELSRSAAELEQVLGEAPGPSPTPSTAICPATRKSAAATISRWPPSTPPWSPPPARPWTCPASPGRGPTPTGCAAAAGSAPEHWPGRGDRVWIPSTLRWPGPWPCSTGPSASPRFRPSCRTGGTGWCSAPCCWRTPACPCPARPSPCWRATRPAAASCRCSG